MPLWLDYAHAPPRTVSWGSSSHAAEELSTLSFGWLKFILLAVSDFPWFFFFCLRRFLWFTSG